MFTTKQPQSTFGFVSTMSAPNLSTQNKKSTSQTLDMVELESTTPEAIHQHVSQVLQSHSTSSPTQMEDVTQTNMNVQPSSNMSNASPVDQLTQTLTETQNLQTQVQQYQSTNIQNIDQTRVKFVTDLYALLKTPVLYTAYIYILNNMYKTLNVTNYFEAVTDPVYYKLELVSDRIVGNDNTYNQIITNLVEPFIAQDVNRLKLVGQLNDFLLKADEICQKTISEYFQTSTKYTITHQIQQFTTTETAKQIMSHVEGLGTYFAYRVINVLERNNPKKTPIDKDRVFILLMNQFATEILQLINGREMYLLGIMVYSTLIGISKIAYGHQQLVYTHHNQYIQNVNRWFASLHITFQHALFNYIVFVMYPFFTDKVFVGQVNQPPQPVTPGSGLVDNLVRMSNAQTEARPQTNDPKYTSTTMSTQPTQNGPLESSLTNNLANMSNTQTEARLQAANLRYTTLALETIHTQITEYANAILLPMSRLDVGDVKPRLKGIHDLITLVNTQAKHGTMSDETIQRLMAMHSELTKTLRSDVEKLRQEHESILAASLTQIIQYLKTIAIMYRCQTTLLNLFVQFSTNINTLNLLLIQKQQEAMKAPNLTGYENAIRTLISGITQLIVGMFGSISTTLFSDQNGSDNPDQLKYLNDLADAGYGLTKVFDIPPKYMSLLFLQTVRTTNPVSHYMFQTSTFTAGINVSTRLDVLVETLKVWFVTYGTYFDQLKHQLMSDIGQRISDSSSNPAVASQTNVMPNYQYLVVLLTNSNQQSAVPSIVETFAVMRLLYLGADNADIQQILNSVPAQMADKYSANNDLKSKIDNYANNIRTILYFSTDTSNFSGLARRAVLDRSDPEDKQTIQKLETKLNNVTLNNQQLTSDYLTTMGKVLQLIDEIPTAAQRNTIMDNLLQEFHIHNWQDLQRFLLDMDTFSTTKFDQAITSIISNDQVEIDRAMNINAEYSDYFKKLKLYLTRMYNVLKIPVVSKSSDLQNVETLVNKIEALNTKLLLSEEMVGEVVTDLREAERGVEWYQQELGNLTSQFNNQQEYITKLLLQASKFEAVIDGLRTENSAILQRSNQQQGAFERSKLATANTVKEFLTSLEALLKHTSEGQMPTQLDVATSIADYNFRSIVDRLAQHISGLEDRLNQIDVETSGAIANLTEQNRRFMLELAQALEKRPDLAGLTPEQILALVTQGKDLPGVLEHNSELMLNLQKIQNERKDLQKNEKKSKTTISQLKKKVSELQKTIETLNRPNLQQLTNNKQSINQIAIDVLDLNNETEQLAQSNVNLTRREAENLDELSHNINQLKTAAGTSTTQQSTTLNTVAPILEELNNVEYGMPTQTVISELRRIIAALTHAIGNRIVDLLDKSQPANTVPELLETVNRLAQQAAALLSKQDGEISNLINQNQIPPKLRDVKYTEAELREWFQQNEIYQKTMAEETAKRIKHVDRQLRLVSSMIMNGYAPDKPNLRGLSAEDASKYERMREQLQQERNRLVAAEVEQTFARMAGPKITNPGQKTPSRIHAERFFLTLCYVVRTTDSPSYTSARQICDYQIDPDAVKIPAYFPRNLKNFHEDYTDVWTPRDLTQALVEHHSRKLNVHFNLVRFRKPKRVLTNYAKVLQDVLESAVRGESYLPYVRHLDMEDGDAFYFNRHDNQELEAASRTLNSTVSRILSEVFARTESVALGGLSKHNVAGPQQTYIRLVYSFIRRCHTQSVALLAKFMSLSKKQPAEMLNAFVKRFVWLLSVRPSVTSVKYDEHLKESSYYVDYRLCPLEAALAMTLIMELCVKWSPITARIAPRDLIKQYYVQYVTWTTSINQLDMPDALVGWVWTTITSADVASQDDLSTVRALINHLPVYCVYICQPRLFEDMEFYYDTRYSANNFQSIQNMLGLNYGGLFVMAPDRIPLSEPEPPRHRTSSQREHTVHQQEQQEEPQEETEMKTILTANPLQPSEPELPMFASTGQVGASHEEESEQPHQMNPRRRNVLDFSQIPIGNIIAATPKRVRSLTNRMYESPVVRKTVAGAKSVMSGAREVGRFGKAGFQMAMTPVIYGARTIGKGAQTAAGAAVAGVKFISKYISEQAYISYIGMYGKQFAENAMKYGYEYAHTAYYMGENMAKNRLKDLVSLGEKGGEYVKYVAESVASRIPSVETVIQTITEHLPSVNAVIGTVSSYSPVERIQQYGESMKKTVGLAFQAFINRIPDVTKSITESGFTQAVTNMLSKINVGNMQQILTYIKSKQPVTANILTTLGVSSAVWAIISQVDVNLLIQLYNLTHPAYQILI